jgi:mannose-6-phosphate isomerase-like protein (cupin superfamily)
MDQKEARKKARLGLNPYNEWVAREGLIVHEGISCDLLTAETKHWPRLGVNGAAVHLRGRGDFANLFLIDIPPGASTEPQHHLYEEVMYVVEGRGSCELEFGDGRKHSFEWQPTSMFAIPLNATYRLHNGDGKNRAVIGSVTSLPLMMKIFHSDTFIFNNTHFFDDRVGDDEHYTGGGDLTMIRPGSNIWETNFIPDLASIELHAWNERGAGSSNLMFILADSNMHAHCSAIQAGTCSPLRERATRCCGSKAKPNSRGSTGSRASCSRRSTDSSTSTS